MLRIAQALTAATLLLAIFALSACGEVPTPAPTATSVPPTETPAPPPTATIEAPAAAAATPTTGPSGGNVSGDALSLLKKSQQAMLAVKSYHVTMTTEAAGVTASGEGDVEPPDKVRITMDLGSIGKSEVIFIGGDTYIKQPGVDQYMHIAGTGNPLGGSPGMTNPQQLTGLADLATSASIVGTESLEGVQTTHVTFTYDANKALQGATGASGAPTPPANIGQTTGDIWIEDSTSYVRQLKITTEPNPKSASPVNRTSIVTVKYSKFNEPVSPPIEKPTNIIPGPGNVSGPGDTPTP
jgi:hypothetical protein